MKFRFSPVPNPHNPQKPYLTPLVEVQLLGDNGAMLDPTPALVDSGAHDTMVNADFALELGIDLRNARPMQILGIAKQPVTAKLGICRLLFLKMKQEIQMPVLFVYDSNVDVVLGRQGFFDRYTVRFDLPNDTFEIREARAK
jgi:hypothetical protein